MKKILVLILFINLSISGFSEEKKMCRPTCACPKNFAYSNNICFNYREELSFLLMNFFEDGTDYVEIADSQPRKSQTDQQFNPGLRLTIGFPISKINEKYLDLSWTYINMKRSSDTNTHTTLLNLFLPPQSLTGTKASGTISGNFNTLDLNFFKPYHVSKHYISNPSIGFRSAFIDQDFKIEYTISSTINKVKAKNDYWGIGLKAGYGADFIITSNYSFYAKTAFSLLYGRTKVSQSSDTFVSNLEYVLNEKRYSVMPNAELAFGFSFDRSFSNNLRKFSLKIGYEFQHWWDQNNLRRFMATDPTSTKRVARNSLKFNGLVFNISLDL